MESSYAERNAKKKDKEEGTHWVCIYLLHYVIMCVRNVNIYNIYNM